tara:strand:+ start:21246 stop:22640 length:1395 start_codon:yes stop_codon:yes gene_type:complete
MVFYKLFLENEKMHHFKRFYLLASLIFSLCIPLVTFTEYVEPVLNSAIVIKTTQNSVEQQVITQPTLVGYLPKIMWGIYGLGVLIFGINFILNLFQIVKRIKQNLNLKLENFIAVLVNDTITPHTFFSYIFLNKQKFVAQEIPKEVIIHEKAHAEQKHSIDILFVELLQIVFWFHPLTYLIKNDIKLNHEFLADDAVLNKGFEPSIYQHILLAFSSNVSEPILANAINYSSIKKRITIMKTNTSKQKIWILSILLLPLITLTLYGFSNKEIIAKEKIQVVLNELKQNIQEEASSEELAEYNKLAKQYNAQPEENRVVKLKDLKRLEYIFNKMSKKQKANAEPFPNCPPPPPAPKVLKGKELPPPPPIPPHATPEQKKKMQMTIEDYNNKVPPPPPAPPAPKSPLDHVIEMAKKDAVFFYEGKPISSDEAINYLKKNNQLNISTKDSKSKHPRVYISSNPIIIKN